MEAIAFHIKGSCHLRYCSRSILHDFLAADELHLARRNKPNISFCQLLFRNSPRSRRLPYITESSCGCSCGRRDSNAWRRIYSHRECRGEQISHHYQFAALRFDACLGGWTHIGNRCCTDGAGFCTHLCKDQ